VYRFLLFCPDALMVTKEFYFMMELGMNCIGNQHREATRAVLNCMTFCITESRRSTQRLAYYQQQIDQCIISLSEQLIETILWALAKQSPSVLYGHVSDLFYALWSTWMNSFDGIVEQKLIQTQTLSIHTTNTSTIVYY
jgi:hypothetical protein